MNAKTCSSAIPLAAFLLASLFSPVSAQPDATSAAPPSQPGSPSSQPPQPPYWGPGMMMYGQGGPYPGMGMGPLGGAGWGMGMMGLADPEAESYFPGIGMIDRVEGRLAFLRAELKISDAQAGVWNEFAKAVRDNSKRLSDAHGAALKKAASASEQTLSQRLEAQEQWFAARVEGLRTIRQSFDRLYAALSDEQKQSADQLSGPHMGLPMMGRGIGGGAGFGMGPGMGYGMGYGMGPGFGPGAGPGAGPGMGPGLGRQQNR